jgi:sugar phosphate permease
MMPGGIICGFVSDLYGGRRACVCATMMILLIPLLLVLAFYMDTIPVVTLLILLCIMGCLVGGPNNIITSAVAADLADDPSIKGSNKALSTVTGIINGSGSVTAAFGQMAIPVLYGWGKDAGVGYRYVWFFLVFCTVMGTALLGPKIYRELFVEHVVAVNNNNNNTKSNKSSLAAAAVNKSDYQTLSTDPSIEMKDTRQMV